MIDKPLTMPDFVGEIGSVSFFTKYTPITFYLIVLRRRKLLLRHYRHPDQTLKPTYTDGFKLEFVEVKFERNTEGSIQGLKIFTPRIRGVPFHRVESPSPLQNGKHN